MGCDIHAFIEFDRYESGDYDTFAEMHLSRHYDLFGHMAGVRRDVTPVVEPRGIPHNTGWQTQDEVKEWEGDAHHASWMTKDELQEVWSKCPNSELESVIAMMEILDNAGQKPRLVFWFDN